MKQVTGSLESSNFILSRFVNQWPRRALHGRACCFFCSLFVCAALSAIAVAVPIPVLHKEGTAHGFIVLKSKDGETLATGDMVQTVKRGRVTTDLVLHFKDGSIHQETAVYTQGKEFRLLTDHLRQDGPSFPKPIDAVIDVASGNIRISIKKDGKDKSEDHHLQIPEDASNGLMIVVLKNISPEAETTVSMVSTSEKPRVVKLRIRSEGEQEFLENGSPRKARNYVIHVDIGGIAGAVASIMGKQPPDVHIWQVEGPAPTFVRFDGPLYEDGPIWSIQLADLKWSSNGSP